ncbi:nipped-B-like protein [Planococcus citri]|uniref:nipped-B-like protein n=1 Tax=Planococcus citri TaxID=170843 RepID=UPI0031F9E3B8
MYRSMQNIDRQHDLKSTCNDGRQRMAMNGETPTVPITTLAGISSLTDLLPEMPLPSPLPHTLSNKSLLFHPRVAEEANNLLNLRDENLVPLLANSLSQTTSDHIELKDHYACTDQLIDHQYQPELLKAIVQRNPTVFKNASTSQRMGWHHQQRQTQQPQQILLQQQMQQQKQQNFQQPQQRMQQPLSQSFQQPLHHHQNKPSDQNQARHVLQQQSPQSMLQQSQASPQSQQQMQMQQQFHSQQVHHMQQGQLGHQQSVISMGPSSSSGSPVVSASNNFMPKMASPANASATGNYNSTTSVDYVNNSINTYSPSAPSTRSSARLAASNAAQNYQDSVVNSVVNSSFQQHNFIPSTSQNTRHVIHGGAGDGQPPYTNADGASTSGNYSPYPAIVQNSSPMLASLPTPAATPSPTPAQSPNRFMQRASVITSDNTAQQNGMYSIPNVDKFLMGEDINLNMSDQSMDVGDLNSSLMQPNMVQPYSGSQDSNMVKIPSIIDPATNQPIQISEQLQSQIESQLQLDAAAQSHMNSQEIYPADMLESTIGSSVCGTDNLLANDVSSNIPIISGDLSMTPPLSSSVPQLDSVPAQSDFNSLATERASKRKRNSRIPETPIKDEEYVPKPKLKKIERKLVPVLEKLIVEELTETNPYQKFNQSLDRVFDHVEDMDISLDAESDDEVPEETLLPKYQLLDLCSEAAKLKSLGCMESIPSDKLIRLLGILEKNIRSGIKVSPIADENDDESERKLWMELAMERIMRAVDASLISLYVLTSPNMNKKVYLEDVIDKIILFTKYQLHNTIYPVYDPVYRTKQKKKDTGSRKKKSNSRDVREKSIVSLYTKLVEIISLLSELLNIQPLTDNSILHLSTMGVGPFFVEGINELQLTSLKLVTSIFMKYEKHRKLLLDDILASMARLPNSKQSLRSYRLSSQEHIQILTALVLQLIQCMVVLPKNAASRKLTWDPDSEISRKFKAAQTSASNFLVVFLSKCSSKSEEIDYRPLFENFIQDLLTTVNKPEWPVSELMLSVLGKLLVTNFVNTKAEMALRVASLDYLGVVAARLRKDSVTSNLKLSTIDTIIKDIRAEELKDDDKPVDYDKLEIGSDEERIMFLQRVLLDYLAVKSHNEDSLAHARHFYICQWYQDALNEANAPTTNKTKHSKTPKKKNKKRWKDSSDEDTESEEEEEDEEKIKETKNIIDEKIELRKQFYLNKINPFEIRDNFPSTKVMQTEIQHTYIDYESAELVSRYLASKRPFSRSFETFLKHIIKVLMETSVGIRTKAMKCLTMIVEADPGVLALKEMQMGVFHSFLDHSTSVREAAVDLVGKFVLNQPSLIDNYYEMLSNRLLDTGVSVRKRVIKILKDICIEYPEYSKIPEICVKMIRRVNDEEGIRKLVMEVFQNMWFTPVKESSRSNALKQKVMHITDVVSACKEMGLEWFEQLLVSLFKPKEDKDDSTKVVTEPPKILVTACKQIVDCLIDNIITLDGRGGNAPQRLVACVTTLYMFAKIRPQLLVEHAITLQPYLSLRCQTQGDYQIISCVARILEIVVPMLEHASEMFLSQLEEDSVKLIFQHDQTVILSCISCLGSVVNNVTRNFPLIRDCFLRYFNPLIKLKTMMDNGGNINVLNNPAVRVDFRRSMYIVGLMLRFFDFKDKEVRGDKLSDNICNEVFDTLSYFMHIDDKESRLFALRSVGSMCIRHYEYMLGPELMAHYQLLLRGEDTPIPMKVQVLNNIKVYLQEEEKRMIKQDEEWATLCKKENLKEMNDVSSGMASTIIQLYLKDVLESFLHPSSSVRQAALGVIQLILSQGLVHPVQIVPYLICMSTDEDKSISVCADKQLQDIEKKYPGFIHMKAQNGIKLSFTLQKIIQGTEVARGFREKEGELPSALNGFLYSILRSKQQRRALMMSILKQFDETVKTNLAQMLYLADNVAYFPYQVLDEPLFIIHHINIMISVTGTNLVQSFKEALLPNPDLKQDPEHAANAIDEDDDEDEESLLKRLPEDTSVLQDCMIASQGCLMLLVLKQHLKTLYGFTDSKIALYSPSESAKVYEKSLNKKNVSKFNPKAALQKLKSKPSDDYILDEKSRQQLIAEYLEFKQLIISLDREDDDDDDNTKSQNTSKVNNVYSGPNASDSSQTPTKAAKGDHNSSSSSTMLTPTIVLNSIHSTPASGQTNVSTPNSSVNNSFTPNHSQVTPKVPKLTIVPPKPPPESSRHSHSHSHRSHKSKKSDRHKKHHHKRKKKSYKSDESDDAASDPDYSL